MTDVFISYSRKDIAFARLVHQALLENGLETWIDWQDIPPSADWLAEVYGAIEGADAFVFVISGTSLASEICGLEIAHAAEHNKRLIPIVIKDVDAGQVPKELAILNWIFFEEAGEKFEKAMGDLVTAITVDQDWVKAHTRFENRALAWERKENDQGLLLRGSDLTEAETWLAGSAGKDPQPTALQTQYILKSREDSTRRQRMTLMGVGAALIVAVGLGVLAWTQRNVAVAEGNARATQQAIAEEQRNIAEARQLAASALNKIENNIDLALLLSVEGYKKYDNYLTKSSLLSTLQEDPNLLRQFHGKNVNTTLVYDPDGEFFVSTEGTVICFWDPKRGIQVGEPLLGHTQNVDQLAINPEGSLLASVSIDGTLKLWDIDSRTLVDTLLSNERTDYPRTIRFSVSGDLLISSTSQGKVWVWDVETYKVLTPNLEPLMLGRGHIGDVFLSQDGKTIITHTYDLGIEFWDLESGDKLGDLDLDDETISKLNEIELSPDGKILAGFDDEDYLYFWNLQTYKLLSKSLIHNPTQLIWDSDIAFHPAGNFLFIANDEAIEYWDVKKGSYAGTFIYLGKMSNFFRANVLAFSPDGKLLLLSGKDNIIRMWNIYKDNQENDPFWNYPGLGHGLAISETESMLAATGSTPDDDFVIHLWNTEKMTYIDSIRLGKEDEKSFYDDMLVFHPDGYIIFSGIGDEIRFYDPDQMQMMGSPLFTGVAVSMIALSPDGKTLAVEQQSYPDEYVQFWDLESRQSVGEILLDPVLFLDNTQIYDFAFSPDGKILAISHNSGLITFWDVQSLQILGDPLPAHGNSFVYHLAFSSDGNILASSDNQGIIKLWDTNTRYSIGVPMTGHTSNVTSLIFNKDASILFSGDDDANIRLWDVQSQQPIGLPITGINARQLSAAYEGYDDFYGLYGHESSISNMVISSDGSKLITKDNSGKIRTWDLEPNSWIKKACFRAGRNMTQNEWFLYFTDEPYRETCPQFSSKQISQISPIDDTTITGLTRMREIDGMMEIYISAGEFEMGSEDGRAMEQSVHTVYLDAFWIDQTEVTNAQYALCVDANQCTQPSSNSSYSRSSSYYGNKDYDDYPVIYVTWGQASDYCNWIGGQLPTEAEWEKAARGTDSRNFPWGNKDPNSTLLNFHELIGDTTQVGGYQAGASPYGVLDMAGNVFEWVFDWFDEDYYVRSPKKNPAGPETGEWHVFRGGSWEYPIVFAWQRDATFSSYFADDIGFRCRTSQ